MNISEAIAKRKSIRAYLDKTVPEGDLEKILEAGRWAPNAGPFQVTVIRNAQLRQKIDDRTLEAMVKSGIQFLQQRAAIPGYRPLYGAPVLALLSASKEGLLGHLGPMNTSLAAENMILEATGLGLGSSSCLPPWR